MKSLETQTQILELSNHKTLSDYLIVVSVNINESGVTTRARQYEDRPDIGLVTSVGDKVDKIKEGDVIFFGRYSSDSVTYDGIQYLLIRQEDVYCVVENE